MAYEIMEYTPSRKCSKPLFKSANSHIIIIKFRGKAVHVPLPFNFFIQIPQIMNTKPFPPSLWSSLSFGLEGGDVGIFSRTKDQPTASLMHSLCAACSWRQALCSGASPWYCVRFPREHTLIAGLLSITELKISPFSRGDSVSNTGHLIFISLFHCKK